MAKKKKVRGRPFPKGVSGNPNGRPRKDPKLVAVASALKQHVIDSGGLLLMSSDELKELFKDQQPTVFQSLILKASVKGDDRVINALVDRILGKAPQSIDLKADVEVTGELTDEQLKGIAEEYLKAFHS